MEVTPFKKPLQLPDPLSGYALTGGSVFDARQEVALSQTAVWVEGSYIRAVCRPDELPDNLDRVDVSGCTILPGLVDVHAHTEDWHAPLFLAAGITSVRDVGCSLEPVLQRRARWNASLSAPRLVCTGPVLDCPGNTWPALTRLVHSPVEARQQVDDLLDHGVDQIKAYAFLDRPCFDAIVDQAHRRGRFVLSHLGKQVNARQAVEAGLDELEHLSGVAEALAWERNQSGENWDFFKLWASVDLERANRLIDLFLEKGTWIAVTRLVWLRLASTWDGRLQSHPQMVYLPAPLQDFWETFNPKNPTAPRQPRGMKPPGRVDRCQQVAGMAIFTAELVRRGAKILVGTDAPFPNMLPGFSYHDELQALLECGMSEAAVLQAATLSGAQALGIEQMVGTVEPGKQADLLVVRGDPTENILALQQIETIVRAGHGINPHELLAQAKEYALTAVPSAEKRFDSYY
jgi:imidazolonepropionase-like amidohydrolase